MSGILLLYNNYISMWFTGINNQWVLTNHSAHIIFSYWITADSLLIGSQSELRLAYIQELYVIF